MKKLIAFDLDGTLAESKSPVDSEMADLLCELLGVVHVAVISGGDWPQYQKQLLSGLCCDYDRLSLLPTCGTKYYRYNNGQWVKLYSDELTPEEKEKIVESIWKAAGGFLPDAPWGDLIEDRGSQITFSALGQMAPVEEKKAWDPDFAKRKVIKASLDWLIPEFSVRMGGATSIDVTKPGVDKGHGIRRLTSELGIGVREMVYVGDAIFPGGNDYAVKEAGVACISVDSPAQTKMVIASLATCLREWGPSRPHS